MKTKPKTTQITSLKTNQKQMLMKKIFTLFTVMLCLAVFANAQTFEWYVDGATITYVPEKTENIIAVSGATNTNNKYTGTYNGITCTKGLKVESGTIITIANTKKATVTVVQSMKTNGTRNIKFDGTEQTNGVVSGDVKVYTIENVEPGSHTVARTSELGLIYIGVVYESNGDTREPAPVSYTPGSMSFSWSERGSFVAPTLVNEKNLDVVIAADGQVVAYDEATKTFSILKAGNGFIKATYTATADSEYSDNVAMCNVTVKKDVHCVNYPVGNLSPEVMLTMPAAGEIAAGYNFGGDAVLNASTPYATKFNTDKTPTMFGETFDGYMQVRAKNAPAEGSLNGDENAGSTTVVFAPVKNVTLYVYGRQQSLNQEAADANIETWGFTPNDGKSVKLIAHSDPATLVDATHIFSEWESDAYQYGYLATAYELKAGEKYTLFALGTTYGVFGIGYSVSEAAPEIQAPAHDQIADGMIEFEVSREIVFTPAADSHVVYTCFEPTVAGIQALAAEATIEHEGKTYTLAADNKVLVNQSGQLHYFAMDPATGVKSPVNTLEFSKTTGIADIDVDNANAPVEYFNLQGIRVENPANGLYIRRQGNKVEKIYVK